MWRQWNLYIQLLSKCQSVTNAGGRGGIENGSFRRSSSWRPCCRIVTIIYRIYKWEQRFKMRLIIKCFAWNVTILSFVLAASITSRRKDEAFDDGGFLQFSAPICLLFNPAGGFRRFRASTRRNDLTWLLFIVPTLLGLHLRFPQCRLLGSPCTAAILLRRWATSRRSSPPYCRVKSLRVLAVSIVSSATWGPSSPTWGSSSMIVVRRRDAFCSVFVVVSGLIRVLKVWETLRWKSYESFILGVEGLLFQDNVSVWSVCCCDIHFGHKRLKFTMTLWLKTFMFSFRKGLISPCTLNKRNI